MNAQVSLYPLALLLALLTACSERGVPSADASDASAGDAKAPDVGSSEDAAGLAGDASSPPDAASGASCFVNQDCPAAERCGSCSNGDCRCELGARGQGRPGLDPCTSGNDCSSALCIDGPGGDLICSDACDNNGQCPLALPRCLTLAGLGSFCARAAPGSDAGVDPITDAGIAACTGACATTSLVAQFGTAREVLTRAQHGTSGADELYVEAHFGGEPACPSETSPTPDRTLVVSGVRALADPRAQTEADGVRATLFDFVGTLTSLPLLSATAVQVVPRYVDPGVAISFEVTATFSEGTITGGFFAPHCGSLDGP